MIIIPMMAMNLFLAVVVEGYFESLRENEAIINPQQMDSFLEKWSEYDPGGEGYLTPEQFAFLLHELHPPVGVKDDNVKFEYDLNCNKKIFCFIYICSINNNLPTQ